MPAPLDKKLDNLAKANRYKDTSFDESKDEIPRMLEKDTLVRFKPALYKVMGIPDGCHLLEPPKK